MKNGKRLLALIVAFMLMVYGMPLNAMAANDEENNTLELPQTAMRFVQSNFDSASGILTMSLQVKPQESASGKDTVADGVFVFQTHANTVIPVTRPSDGSKPQEIRDYNGKVAMVSKTSSAYPAIEEYVNSGRAVMIADGYKSAMSASDAVSLSDSLNGLLVSGGRVLDWTDEAGVEHPGTGMLDCYLQFSFGTADPTLQDYDLITDDGYVEVAQLDFQCYSGYDEHGFPMLAKNTEGLFSESIRVPASAEEAQAIVDQFYYVNNDGEKVPMAMGAAGFIQAAHTAGYKEGNGYYYYTEPTLSNWRKGTSSRLLWSRNGAYPLDDSPDPDELPKPGLLYDNMENTYILTGFAVDFNNTYSTDEGATSWDFKKPDSESSSYPRYVVPEKTKSDKNDENGRWIPDAYLGTGPVPLKYYVGTTLSDNSVSSPEHEDIQAMMENIRWEFLIDAAPSESVGLLSLQKCNVVEEAGEGDLIPTADGKYYRVKTAKIQDSRVAAQYQDCKVWNVYTVESENDPSPVYFMTCPVGITLDMMDTEVSYYDAFAEVEREEDKDKTATVKAPQLHVTSQAADGDNYIWHCSTVGEIMFQGVYMGSAEFPSTPLPLRMYKDPARPGSADLKTESMDQAIELGEGDCVPGFWVGNTQIDGKGTETPKDAVSEGISLRSTLYDQYGIPISGKWTTVSISPTAETQQAMNAAGKSVNPFRIVQVERPVEGAVAGTKELTNEYTILYRDGMDVSDVVAGEYVLTAVHGSASCPPKTLTVKKAEEYLNYMRTSLTSGDVVEKREVAGGTEITVDMDVPTRTSTGVDVVLPQTINLWELADQWRDTSEETVENAYKYDIVPNLRTSQDSLINFRKARQAGVDVGVEANGEVPQGIDIGDLNRTGVFTYSNRVPDASTFSCTVTASYGGHSRFVKYTFRFTRDQERAFQQVKISRPEGGIQITVPSRGVATYDLKVIPYDQYGSQWGWPGVEAKYPGQTWSVHAEGDLPKGVSLIGDNNGTIQVDPTAENCVFQVYAQFSATRSALATVQVLREPIRPTNIKSIIYNGTNTAIVPEQGRDPLVLEPVLDVVDQYGDPITEFEESKEQNWTYRLSNSAAGSAIHVNTANGTVTVDPCALDCTVTLTAYLTKNNTTKFATVKLEIKRDTAKPSSIEIVERSDENPIKYPTVDGTGESRVELTAVGSTQYGEGQAFGTNELTWTLDSVLFVDEESPVTQINHTGGVYTDNRGSVNLTDRGVLTFNGITQKNQLPAEITVSVNYGGRLNDTATLKIHTDVSVPHKIEMPTIEYRDGIQIPAEIDGPKRFDLKASLRDQYGIFRDDLSVIWTAPEGVPTGVEAHLDEGYVLVDHTASVGTFPVMASYPGVRSETRHVTIRQDDPLIPTTIDITGMRDSKGALVESGFSIPLPDKPAKEADVGKPGVGDSYTMTWTVRSQFTQPMSAVVEWEIESTSGGIVAQITETDKNTGVLTVTYTEAAWASETSQIVVKATAAINPAAVQRQTITVTKQASYPATAKAVVKSADTVDESDPTKPVVPRKGEPANAVIVEAVAYDQYGKAMNEWPVTMTLGTVGIMGAGLSFQQITTAGPGSVDTNRGVLTLQSNVVAQEVRINAAPEKDPAHGQNAPKTGALDIVLSKGTKYAFELVLDEQNAKTFAIPYWGSEAMANVPTEGSPYYLDLSAWVHDQYDAWLDSVSAQIHPVWELAEEYTGVEFSAGTKLDSQGRAEGENIVLSISHDAIDQGKLWKDIKLRVHTSTKENDTSGDFVKECTVRLTRDAPLASYLYIDGVKKDGVAEQALNRPYADIGSVVYQFSAAVYDQYGMALEDAEIDLDIAKPAIEDQDAVVEEVYRPGQSAEKGDRPIAYKIYHVEYDSEAGEDSEGTEVLIAEFSRETGELTVYTECSILRSILFVAKCEMADGSTVVKRMELPIEQESTLRAYSVFVNRSHGDFLISGEKESISDFVNAIVYDQYGNPYTGKTRIVWSLHLKDKEGELIQYSELDQEGNQRYEGERLVELSKAMGYDSSNSASSTLVVVEPERYFEDKTVILQCLVVDTANMSSEYVYGYADINVRRRSSGGGSLTVTFDAGLYGKLVGASTVAVGVGEVIPNPPGVKTLEGYGFMGWTTDGAVIVDASKTPVFGDTAYVAVYKDITNTKFLDGYKDKSVRPEQSVTRAEFITMIVRALGGYDPEVDYGGSYKDVADGKWYTNYIAFAKKQGITAGYPDGTYRPNAPITRAEAARLLAVAAKYVSGESGAFSDIDESAWYAAAVNALHEAGVISGYEDGTFRPAKRITRAEAVKLVVMVTKNALNDLERGNIQKYAYCPFTDVNKGHWAYAYILRAAGIA